MSNDIWKVGNQTGFGHDAHMVSVSPQDRVKNLAVQVGMRLETARENKRLTRAALASQITQGPQGRVITAETVRLWETGRVLPPMDKIFQLADLFGETPENLMFAVRRQEDMRKDGDRLARITPIESDLLYTFRRIDAKYKQRALDLLLDIAKAHPALPPEVIPLKKPKKA